MLKFRRTLHAENRSQKIDFVLQVEWCCNTIYLCVVGAIVEGRARYIKECDCCLTNQEIETRLFLWYKTLLALRRFGNRSYHFHIFLSTL